jgi:hypothetical protein
MRSISSPAQFARRIIKVATSRYFFSAFAAVAAIAMLAGCGGSQLSPQAPTQASSTLGLHSPVSSPQVKGHCPARGGVRVTPCTIDLTLSSPGPDTVVVRTPKNKKGTLSEFDNCGGPSGVATVAQGSGNTWIVTAGPTTGSCTAEFDYLSFKHGKKIGWAQLSITNSV